MSMRELITKWGFKVESEPLDKVEKQLEGIKHRLEFLAADEVIKGIYELTERFAHFAEELHVAAESAGLTVEAFQRLAFAAGQSSISQEEMSMGLARLARNLHEARIGSAEANLAFQQAGITPTQVLGFHTSADALAALADRFRAIQDPIQKQALAMQLFGRGSTNFVAFLSQGSGAMRSLGQEAEKLGIILSDHQVESIVKVEHALNELFAVFKSLGATIASYFAPSIELAIKSFFKFWEANKKIIDTNIRAFVYDLTFAMGAIYEAVRLVVQKFLDLSGAHQTLVRRVFEVVVALGVLVGVIWGLQKVLGILKGGFDLLKFVIAPIQFGWAKIFQPAVFWIGNIVRVMLSQLFLTLATLTETLLPGLSAAFLAVGAAIEATPIGWIITGLAALVVILHDAYTLLFGSGKWEDTWIAKAFNAAKGFGGKALSFFGLGGESTDNKTYSADDIQKGLGNMNTFQGTGGAPISTIGGGAGNNSTVNATNTFNIYGSDPKETADKVAEKFNEHMDRHNRRLQNSFASAQDY